VALNPSLDKTLSVPQWRPGAVLRAQLLGEDYGGKGVNVARAVRILGLPGRLIGFAGGWTGQAMVAGLAAAGYDVQFIEVEGETRRNITLLDEATGVYTKINEPGPAVGPQQLAAFEALVGQMAGPGTLWAFSGRLPPGAPADFYARLIRLAQARGGLAFLDCSGPELRAGLAGRPFALKPNSEEAAELLGRPLQSDADHAWAVRRLQEAGVRLVALSRGAQGLVLAMDDALLIAVPPPVVARSPIGAGDAALAGLLWAVSEGCDAAETARRAVACGTAAAMQEGTGLGDRALIEHLLGRVEVYGP
jgi:1-phosphofructokinase family hexose kinase